MGNDSFVYERKSLLRFALQMMTTLDQLYHIELEGKFEDDKYEEFASIIKRHFKVIKEAESKDTLLFRFMVEELNLTGDRMNDYLEKLLGPGPDFKGNSARAVASPVDGAAAKN